MTRKLISSAFISLIIMFTAVPVFQVLAEDDTTGTETARQQRIEARELRISELKELRQLRIEENKLAIIETRCEKAQDKVTAALAKVGAAQSRRVAVYAKMVEKLDTFLVRFENEGFDSTDLEAKVLTLKDMIAEVETLFEVHLQYLEDISEMDCASDPEGFYTALVEARDTLKTLRTATKELHEYFADVIRGDFVIAIQAIYGSADSTVETDENEDN